MTRGGRVSARPLALTSFRQTHLVAIELDEALVADAEVVRDLVQHHAPDLTAQALAVVAVVPLERAAVDRDLVRRDSRVAARPAGEGNALVEAEQRLPVRRLVLDDDLDVRH